MAASRGEGNRDAAARGAALRRRTRSSPRRRTPSRRSTTARFEEFWEPEGRERVSWFEPFSKLYEWEPPYAKWYLGGKLNVCFNCVDRHVEAGPGTRSPTTGKASPRTSGGRSRSPISSGRRPVRERAQEAWACKGTPGRDLHGHGPGAADRDARLRTPRRPAHRRVRRLLGRLALRSDERHGVRGPDHAGRGAGATARGCR